LANHHFGVLAAQELADFFNYSKHDADAELLALRTFSDRFKEVRTMAEVEPSEPEPSVAPVESAELVSALKDKHAQNSKTASDSETWSSKTRTVTPKPLPGRLPTAILPSNGKSKLKASSKSGIKIAPAIRPEACQSGKQTRRCKAGNGAARSP
jgi:hypothetical protein